jgi:hypothetical protein
LWVWNTPRDGFSGNPQNPKLAQKAAEEADGNLPVRKSAVFENTGANPEYRTAELYYTDQFWSKFGPDDPVVSVNTYDGHVWNVKVDGKVVQTWTIGGSDLELAFKI